MRSAFLFPVLFCVLMASCQTPDILDSDRKFTAYANLAMFVLADDYLADQYGPTGVLPTFGFETEIAGEGRVLGRIEVGYQLLLDSLTNLGNTVEDGSAEWRNFLVRVCGVYLLDSRDDASGPYLGGGVSLYDIHERWKYHDSFLDEDFRGKLVDSSVGMNILFGWRFPTDGRSVIFVELLYDFVAYREGNAGGFFLASGILF